MTDEKWVELIGQMEMTLQIINMLKATPDAADPRCLAVAATHLETAMLWLANAKK